MKTHYRCAVTRSVLGEHEQPAILGGPGLGANRSICTASEGSGRGDSIRSPAIAGQRQIRWRDRHKGTNPGANPDRALPSGSIDEQLPAAHDAGFCEQRKGAASPSSCFPRGAGGCPRRRSARELAEADLNREGLFLREDEASG